MDMVVILNESGMRFLVCKFTTHLMLVCTNSLTIFAWWKTKTTTTTTRAAAATRAQAAVKEGFQVFRATKIVSILHTTALVLNSRGDQLRKTPISNTKFIYR
jgi:hypothetical protein